MDRVIVAFQSEGDCLRVRGSLEAGGIRVRGTHCSGAGAIRAVKRMGGGVVVCGARLSDMTAGQLARELGQSAAVLAVSTPLQREYCQGDGVRWLPVPFSAGGLTEEVRSLMNEEESSPRWSRQQRTAGEEELVRLAKEKLMQSARMNEEEAHRFLQRLCMQRGIRMQRAARRVLETLDAEEA